MEVVLPIKVKVSASIIEDLKKEPSCIKEPTYTQVPSKVRKCLTIVFMYAYFND